MYYTKQKLYGAEIKIEINDETVFTRCIQCGREMQVNLTEEIRYDADFDLYGTGRICSQECLNRFNDLQKNRNQA